MNIVHPRAVIVVMDPATSGLLARPATMLRRLSAVSIGLPLLGFLVIVATVVVTGVDRPESALITATNANNELSAPTWWSITQLGVGAGIALLVAAGAPGARQRRGLLLLGFVMALLSMDELMQGHEFVAEFLAARLDSGALASWALWIVVAVPLFLVLVAVLATQLRGLDRRVKRLLLGAAALYVGCAAGLEAVSAFMEGLPGWVFEIEILLEEAGEASAASIVIYALLVQAQVHRRAAAPATLPPAALPPAALPSVVPTPAPVPVDAVSQAAASELSDAESTRVVTSVPSASSTGRHAAPTGRATPPTATPSTGSHRAEDRGARWADDIPPEELPTPAAPWIPVPRGEEVEATTPIPRVTRAGARG